MATQTEIRERITGEIVQALQNGVLPWRKPWIALENTGFPTNVISKKAYSGINPILLQLAAQKKGLHSKWWATYQQWQALGCQVQKRPDDVPPGAWGTKIIFYKPVTMINKNDKGEEKETTFPLLREYTVFNAEQVEGQRIDQYRPHLPSSASVIDFQRAEHVIAATGADVRHVPGDKACYYRLPLEYIQMPLKSQFEQMAAYYGTAMHELTHWSEHRLDWKSSYALGELRAELGATYLMAALEIPYVQSDHTSYLDSWIRAMQADHRIIFQISSAASKACDFILGFSRQPEEQVEAVPAA